MASSQAKLHLNASQSWCDEMSCAALNATESIFNLHLSLPIKSEVGFTNTQWVQIAFVILVRCRQAVAASKPEQAASFSYTLAQIQQRLTALSSSDVDMNGDRDVFCGFSKRVAHIQARLQGSRGDAVPAGISSSDTSLDPISSSFREPPFYDDSAALAPLPTEYWIPTAEEDFVLPDNFMFDIPIEGMMNFWT